MIRNLLLALSLFLFTGTLFSQDDYTVEEIKINDNNQSFKNYNDLLIDKNGTLWYSVHGGLVQDFGKQQVFHPLTLPNNKFVHSVGLLESKSGIIYLATEKGVYTLNPKSGEVGKLKSIYNNGEEVLLRNPKEDENQNIWFITEEGKAYKYDTSKKFTEYNFDHEKDSQGISLYHKLFFFNSKVFINGADNFQILDEKKKIFKTIYTYKKNEDISSSIVKNGLFFKAGTSGKYKVGNDYFNYQYLPNINAQVIEFPGKREMIICENDIRINDRKIAIINRDNLELKFYSYEKDLHTFSLVKGIKFQTEHIIKSIDGKGNIWIANLDRILKVKTRKKWFKNFLNSKNGDKINSTRGVVVDEHHNIYILSNGRLIQISGTDTKNITSKNKYVFDKYDLWRLSIDKDSLLWVSGYHKNFFKFNLKTSAVDKYLIPAKPYNKNEELFCQAFSPYKKNKYLLGGNFGLLIFDKQTGSFNKFNPKFKLGTSKVRDILVDNETIWVATEYNGLFYFNEKTNEQKHYTIKSALQLSSNELYDIHLTKENKLWIGTTKGFNILDIHKNTIVSYGIEDGLPDSRIVSIIETKEDFWLGTFNGLARFNKKSKIFSKYFEEDGLTDNEFNRASFYKKNDSLLVFGGVNGITQFNPYKIPEKSKGLKTKLIKTFYYNTDKDSVIESIYNLDKLSEIRVPYDKNFVSLSFASFSEKENRIFYKIPKLHSNWLSTSDKSEVNLIGLPEGTNVLKVVSGNLNISENKGIKEYKIIVEKVIYKKRWFQSLSVILFSIIVIIYFLTIRNKQKKEEELLLKINDLNDKAYRAQMNPHFTFNVVNNIQSVLILKGEEAVNKYISSFATLLRITIEISREKEIRLSKEIKYLKAYLKLQELRSDIEIETEFFVDPKLSINTIYIPPMMFQPIIENALKHGLKTKKGDKILQIYFNLKGNKLIGKITDNGIGFEGSKKLKKDKTDYKSYGNKILLERIKIYNETHKEKIIFKTSNLNDEGGTKVILEIPITKNEIK